MKTAICTITVGDFYQRLARDSHPMMYDYAEKIGADFYAKDVVTESVVGYAKLKLVRDLLAEYDRVAFVDTDILIRHDAPSLFDLVPDDAVGAFDEGFIYPDRRETKLLYCQQISATQTPELVEWTRDGRYYNTGVMVVSKRHARLFAEAADQIDNFGEQTLLNYRFRRAGVEMFHLPHRFNRLIATQRITGEQLHDSYLVHFAGAFAHGSPKEANLEAWDEVASSFRQYSETQQVPTFRRRIFVKMAAALGDTVSTEPVVRYLRDVVEPHAEITIQTSFPEVLDHLRARPHTTIVKPGAAVADVGQMIIDLFPATPIASYNQMHPVDYASLCAFRALMPAAHRGIKLNVTCAPPVDTAGMVLVHPGRSWQSKTFPAAWWSDVIRRLLLRGAKVAVIGKNYADDDFRGTVPGLELAADVVDLRDKLTVPELIASIERAGVLISNDSSPVHIAGAFETPVVMISTAKYPEFVWPHRAAGLSVSMGRTIKDPQIVVGLTGELTMHQCRPDELQDVLPEPRDVAAEAWTLRR